MKSAATTLIALFFFVGSSWAQRAELKKVTRWMTGNFSSIEQHLHDTSNYLDIRLSMKRIWANNSDGVWLYVEQAVAGYQDKPYRQRIYHVTQKGKGVFCSDIYTLNAPLRFANHPEQLELLQPDSLSLKQGCSVTLKRDGSSYTGGTEGKNCPSDRNGATYATSQVTLTKKMLVSWDQGFNGKNEQVWGATGGGYRFIKQE